MRWSSPRPHRVALAGLVLSSFVVGRAVPPVHGQDTSPSTAPAPAADLEKRLEALNKSIDQRLDAGQIAEAGPLAREKLELLERTRGKDRWQTGDARRSLETFQGLAGGPREGQDRYVKSRQAEARADELYSRGQFAEAVLLNQ